MLSDIRAGWPSADRLARGWRPGQGQIGYAYREWATFGYPRIPYPWMTTDKSVLSGCEKANVRILHDAVGGRPICSLCHQMCPLYQDNPPVGRYRVCPQSRSIWTSYRFHDFMTLTRASYGCAHLVTTHLGEFSDQLQSKKSCTSLYKQSPRFHPHTTTPYNAYTPVVDLADLQPSWVRFSHEGQPVVVSV